MPNMSYSSRLRAITLLSEVLDTRRTVDEASRDLGDTADDRFIALLVLTTLRHLGQIDAVISQCLTTPLPAKRKLVRHALRMGVAQLVLLQTPPHAAVGETVEAIKKTKDKGLAGLVNAVLQRIHRERLSLGSPIANLPQWLHQRWQAAYGAQVVEAMAAVAALRPPLDLHLPAPATLPVGQRLDEMIWRLPPDHPPVPELPGFVQGAFWVQDIAASYPARLLGDVRGKSVLDLAAAPGGKTAQLARAGANVTAVDKSPSRMQLLQQNMQRLALNVHAITADITQWRPEQPVDAIVLDAPCSATGTWRKHPEVVQLTELGDIHELAALQARLLERAWEWLNSGGMMVYCVCSLEPEEGEQQIAAFLKRHPDASLVPPPTSIPHTAVNAGMLRTRLSDAGDAGGMDGFFAAALIKN